MSAAEPKRVSFMTIDSSTNFPKKSEKEAATGATKSKTIRLELSLEEPDAKRNSDFNYKKLIHIEKKKQKKLAKILPNGFGGPQEKSDPFGDDDNDVARIAREMEAKYGTGSSYGGKSGAPEYDRGIGYDDNDSFIDNTEAYDEIIPEDVDTVRGGFYVNSGLLEFKKIPNFERPGDEIRMPKAKKRALSTTSESSDGEDGPNQELMSSKSKKKKKHAEVKKTKSATSSSDEQGKAAKKAKKEKVAEKPKEKEALPTATAAKDATEKKKLTEKEAADDSKKVIKTTTVKDMLRAKRDNLRKLEQGKSSGGTTTTTDNDDDDGSESVSSLAVSESSRDSHQGEINGGATATPTTTTTSLVTAATAATKELSLPSNFSPELVQLITGLKQYADTALKNTSNFFDNHVKEQLLRIDTVAKSQSQQVRLQVYNQLEIFVPCTKKTILTKVGRYRTQQAEAKIKNEIRKLKAIVNEAMPDLVRKYDEEQKAHENLKEMQNIVGGDASVELKAPRKKFHWNDNSRKILSDAVVFIHELYRTAKVKKETLEEYTARYLKEQLLPLWPEGWIRPDDFQRELERKKKKEARALTVNTSPASQTSLNGKTPPSSGSQTSHQQQQQQQHQQQQKTESRSKEADVPSVNGKAPSIQLSPQSSVIKRSSDHSINSIMSSTSPSPPIHSAPKAALNSPSTSTLSEAKPRVIDLEKLSSPNDLLKVSQKEASKSVPKYTQSIEVSPEKIRISDGSDSDCAIIDSPIKSTPTATIKPQQQFSQHLNNNKLNHSPVTHQQPQGETKKTKKQENDYSSLINSIASLTNPKTSSQSFLSTPTISEQRNKMDTSHGLNGTSNSEHIMDPPKSIMKGYNNNLHYSINELIVNTSRSASHDVIKGHLKSSEYQKYSNSNNSASHVHNISVITSTNDAVNSSNFSMSPILNLSNKK